MLLNYILSRNPIKYLDPGNNDDIPFQEDILRRSKLIRGNEPGTFTGNPGIAMIGSQSAPALHITEDASRRSREHRAELLRFMREVRKVRELMLLISLVHSNDFVTQSML